MQDPTNHGGVTRRVIEDAFSTRSSGSLSARTIFSRRSWWRFSRRGTCSSKASRALKKTLTVKTLARTIRGTFRRIRFTPDLVPADLVGTRIYNQKTGKFNTSLSPVFTPLLLADEINRAPAKCKARCWR